VFSLTMVICFLNGIDNKRFAGLDADDNCEVAEENFVIMNEN